MRISGAVRSVVAHVTMTIMAYTAVRCPCCNRLVCSLPGQRTVEPRAIAGDSERSGRGLVLACQRCSTLLEVIAHG